MATYPLTRGNTSRYATMPALVQPGQGARPGWKPTEASSDAQRAALEEMYRQRNAQSQGGIGPAQNYGPDSLPGGKNYRWPLRSDVGVNYGFPGPGSAGAGQTPTAQNYRYQVGGPQQMGPGGADYDEMRRRAASALGAGGATTEPVQSLAGVGQAQTRTGGATTTGPSDMSAWGGGRGYEPVDPGFNVTRPNPGGTATGSYQWNGSAWVPGNPPSGPTTTGPTDIWMTPGGAQGGSPTGYQPITPGAAGSIIGDINLPSFDPSQFQIPEYSNSGIDRLISGLDSGAFNTEVVTGLDPLVRQRQMSAEAAGAASGRQAADSLLRSRGAGNEGLAGLLQMQGASQGYRQGLDVADEERWRMTQLNADNAARQLQATLGLSDAESQAFRDKLAGASLGLDANRLGMESALAAAGLKLDENAQLWGQAMDQDQSRLNWANFGLDERKTKIQEDLAAHGIDLDNRQFDLMMQQFALQKEQHGLTMDQMREQLRQMRFTNDQAEEMARLLDEYMEARNSPPTGGQWALGQVGAWRHNLEGMANVLQGAGLLGGGGGVINTANNNPYSAQEARRKQWEDSIAGNITA